MKKRLFGTAQSDKKTENTPLPIWFPKVESIDWEQFDYIYNETVDVISIFKSILTAHPSTAVQSCIQLNGEIEHQDVNEVAASAVIPFYIKIINDDSRPDKVLEIIAASMAMLTENITWISEEFENQSEPKGFDFLNPGCPRNLSEDQELYNQDALTLELVWKSYPIFLQRVQSNKSNIYKTHIINLMVNLIVSRRAKQPKIEPMFYQETCSAIFDFLRDPTCDEHKKTKTVAKLIQLAKYDLSLIEQLRGWGKERANLIWVPRTIAFEISEFENGVYATTEEVTLRKTLSRCGLGPHSEYLPIAESNKIWSDWRKKTIQSETSIHAFPILKKILKQPY